MSAKVYFVTTGLREEVEVIKTVRPPRVLCSYWYFKNRPLSTFCEQLGYRPEIMLDSGAFTAFTQGKNVNLLDYMDYINKNSEYVTRYIALDVIGDSRLTLSLYTVMREQGLRPVPVFHYGEPLDLLERYISMGADFVALGGSVPVRDKGVVAAWCEMLGAAFPGVAFHLLGSSSPKILQTGALASCDSSTWYMLAVNGTPRSIPGKTREAKLARAEANMRKIMEVPQ